MSPLLSTATGTGTQDLSFIKLYEISKHRVMRFNLEIRGIPISKHRENFKFYESIVLKEI